MGIDIRIYDKDKKTLLDSSTVKFIPRQGDYMETYVGKGEITKVHCYRVATVVVLQGQSPDIYVDTKDEFITEKRG